MALLASVMECGALYIVFYQAMEFTVCKPLQSNGLVQIGLHSAPLQSANGSAAQ
jgi:hypothetical protein